MIRLYGGDKVITNNKGSPVPPLRDYQQEALARMQHYEGRAALLVLATGLGKTRIFTEFLRWEVNENDHHCLILSHGRNWYTNH